MAYAKKDLWLTPLPCPSSDLDSWSVPQANSRWNFVTAAFHFSLLVRSLWHCKQELVWACSLEDYILPLKLIKKCCSFSFKTMAAAAASTRGSHWVTHPCATPVSPMCPGSLGGKGTHSWKQMAGPGSLGEGMEAPAVSFMAVKMHVSEGKSCPKNGES